DVGRWEGDWAGLADLCQGGGGPGPQAAVPYGGALRSWPPFAKGEGVSRLENRFFAFSSSTPSSGEGPAVAKAFLAPHSLGPRGVAEVSVNDGITWRVFTIVNVGVAFSATGARTLRSEARARRVRGRLRRRSEGTSEPQDHRARPPDP